MFTGIFHGLRVVGLWAVTAMILSAGNFVPPAEGPVAFRRDRVPLDADAMASLSRDLVTLASGLDAESAVNRRAAAQMLALATALDPGNSKAREVISKFEKGRQSPDADAQQLENSRKRVRRDLEWLGSPEAGSQGQALAACLNDVMIISDPKHPGAEAGERGAWKYWIPDLTAYEPVPEKKEAASEDSADDTAEVAGSGFLLEKAQVFTVVWKQDEKSDRMKLEQGVVPLQMLAEMRKNPEDEERPLSISLGFRVSKTAGSELTNTLLGLLRKQNGTLPVGGMIRIGSPDKVVLVMPPKRQSISAAAAVLTSAAISGIEPDATIIGEVDESGAFKLPPGFWSQLQSLGAGTGGRLILPAAAAEYLPSMLALERPQLFLEYEVLLASDFQELLWLSAKTPDEATARFMANFREIREKANLQSIGQYVANTFVRRRLVEIMQEAPFHYSAKMLAIQGAGNRPAFIPRIILAAELRRAIEPMEWLVVRRESELDPKELNQLGETYDACRPQVDQLFRYAEKDDRGLLSQVQTMVDGIRTLDRNARARGDSYDVRMSVLSAYTTLSLAYRDVTAELARLIGDPPPVPTP